jgi:hypothetical protein
VRIPLNAFFYQNPATGVCSLRVSYLNPYLAQCDNIILGIGFLGAFETVLENDFSDRLNPTQSATIISRDSAKNYISSQVLPLGKDPFSLAPSPSPSPTPDPTPEPEPSFELPVWWMDVLILVCTFILGCGLGLCICALKKGKTARRGTLVNTNTTDIEYRPIDMI